MKTKDAKVMLSLLGIETADDTSTGWFENEKIVYFLEKFDGNLHNSNGLTRFRFDFIGDDFVVLYQQIKNKILVSTRFDDSKIGIDTVEGSIKILNSHKELRYPGLYYCGKRPADIGVNDIIFLIDKETKERDKTTKTTVSNIYRKDGSSSIDVKVVNTAILERYRTGKYYLCYCKAEYLDPNNPKSDYTFFKEEDHSIIEYFERIPGSVCEFDGLIGGSYIEGVHLHRTRDNKRI